jgi:hypothetical protein
MFEDTKRAIRNGKSRDRQYNGQTIQWADNTMDRQYNGQTIQWTDNTMDRQYNGQTIQWAKDNDSQKLHRTLKIEQHELH